jgi:magnesium transporter
MKSIHTKNLTWLYFEKPDKDDLAALQKIFQLHPVILSEFNSPTYRPRVNEYENYIFMVLHFPIFDKETRTPKMGEIDILLNDKYLATSFNEHQRPLHYFFESLRKKQKNRYKDELPQNTRELLLLVIEAMMNACFPKLDHIADRLETIEEQVFQGKEKEMVKEISIVKRDILNFSRTMSPQASILESLAQRNIFEKDLDLKARINDIIGMHIRVSNVLEGHNATVNSLEATNDSLFSYKLNENMKFLTIVSIIFLPATLVAGIFGTNTNIPLDNFWEILLLMGVTMFLTFLIIKFKKLM